MQKAALSAKPSPEMGLSSLVSSLDAQPNEVTTRCRGQGAGLWFPIWSRLVLGGWGLQQTHGEQPCHLESDSRPHCARVRVRFHTWSLEERSLGVGEEAYLHSLRGFGFLKGKKNRHCTGPVIKQGRLSTSVVLRKHQQQKEKNLIQSAGVGNALLVHSRGSFPYSLCLLLHLIRLSSTRLRAAWYP